jgi:GH24 family phage-related lysozyme (muramidase)
MPTLRQKLRQVEQAALRLTGDRRQAVGLRKKIERHLNQLAAGQAGATGQRATGQRVPAVDEAQLLKSLVQFRRAGWVNMPGKSTRVLVERGTGCVLADSKGALILRPREKLLSKPAINRGDFVKYLRGQGIEEYVPHLYLDKYRNVTVGIGHLVPDAKEAKTLAFKKRGTNVGASHTEIERAFNTVKSSGLTNARASAFRNLTSIFITEADAVSQAMRDIDQFLGILGSANYFPEFHTYPVLAKTGLLDLAYNVGADEARYGYKRTTAAIFRRNWKEAGVQQKTNRDAGRASIVQGWFDRAAQQESFFIGHTNCRKPLRQLEHFPITRGHSRQQRNSFRTPLV